ncbi:SO2930 family diheme c-type cytochrome [Tahibacter amnicola]|uniref:Repeat protein (TIGR03806 family) n=1 Tax=Tahibacter amnicola TaxID=2976241 RepID=A0ABY6BKH3_9GAMM|nr:SO2930 family diheme c-type cytochrome [Tahibacter amnicola]UXI68292.1 hypothetical protein N4264_01190 [Tahibacter amnicola]
MKAVARAVGLWLFVILLGGCGAEGPVQFHADGLPAQLSQWKLFRHSGGQMRPNEGVVSFDLNTPLFSDYAHKWRTVWMPAGQSARYSPDSSFDFPVGTIISKTFYYPRGKAPGQVARTAPEATELERETLQLDRVRLVETRLLVRRQEGWLALPYVWNDDQTEATLQRVGALVPLSLVDATGTATELAYQVPDQNQCAGCHATDNRARALQPIGPKARHLNREFDYAGGRENQLAKLSRVGYLTGAPAPLAAPRAANWHDSATPLAARARSYLDINCGHCHSATGAANTSGLWLDAAASPDLHMGLCKQPVAAGKGTGDRLYDIHPGQAQASVLVYRMGSNDPAVMMPELGRSLAHTEGVQLISQWVDSLEGTCGQ